MAILAESLARLERDEAVAETLAGLRHRMGPKPQGPSPL
jgi:hypothetical protein